MTLDEFRIACPCGTVITGRRLPKPQTPRCRSCGESVFVLPRSPLPPTLHGPTAGPAQRARWRFWLVPATAAAVTLLIVASTFAVLLPVLLSETTRPTPTVPAASTDWRRHEDLARQALLMGTAEKASADLGRAIEAAPASERPRLERFRRQVALVANALDEPLSEVVQLAANTPADGWPSRFSHRYRGRAVLFDARLRFGLGGVPEIDYELSAGPVPIRLDLNGFKALRRHPGGGRRVLFGGRLEEVKRDETGWVIRLEPDSGSLVTEPEVLAATSVRDEELTELLRQQVAWVDEGG